MPDYRSLRAWQLARDVAVQSRPWIKKLPPEECDALADQWRRASYSVPLNIAEGASRRGPREFRRHLDIARGSLHEIAVVLDLVVALGYLKESDLVPLRRVRDECARAVWGLLWSIAARSRRSARPARSTSLAGPASAAGSRWCLRTGPCRGARR